MKRFLLALAAMIPSFACTPRVDADHEEMWRKVDAARAAAEASAAAKEAVGQLTVQEVATNPQLAHEDGAPSAKTSARDAARVAAGTAVARGLLLAEWQPKRIAKLDSEKAKQNPACANNAALLVQYDREHDELDIDHETCWYGKSKHANLRWQAAFLSGIVAAELPFPTGDGTLTRTQTTSDLLVQKQLCLNLLEEKQGPTLADQSCDDLATSGLNDDEIATIRSAFSDAKRCAAAIVDANLEAIADLSAEYGTDMLKSATVQWASTEDPAIVRPDCFDFTLPGALTEYRKTHKLVLPKAKQYPNLPNYCVAPK